MEVRQGCKTTQRKVDVVLGILARLLPKPLDPVCTMHQVCPAYLGTKAPGRNRTVLDVALSVAANATPSGVSVMNVRRCMIGIEREDAASVVSKERRGRGWKVD